MSTTTWTIDPAHTDIGFSVKHLMFTTVRGRFADVEGEIVVDDDNPEDSTVEVVIRAASIDTRQADRDTHLRSADFFDVENHEALTFRSRRVDGGFAEPGDAFRVVGDLTIRGTTKEVVLDARFEGLGGDPWGGNRTGFHAETTIDRRDFGLTWNQALETGGVVVGHAVRISLDIQAVEQVAADREAEGVAAD
jgi:polyisoprenoid-binding protein YceI